MAKLVYAAITSVDGYIADEHGDFGWAEPNPEVFTRINELERGFGTCLYGRRMYETLVYWETFEGGEDQPPYLAEFAGIWQGADKVVFSRTLDAVSSARTRIEREFDPEAVRRMKEAAGQDISIGGADLAGQAMSAGLVDEVHLFVTPITVGAGTSAHPLHAHCTLELLSMDHLAGGVAHLHYRTIG
jgi:dihydrofolate reductase